MIDALIKRVSVTYKCYEMYAHRGKKVQLLVLCDWSRNGRHLINYRHCLLVVYRSSETSTNQSDVIINKNLRFWQIMAL
jgi:hypothetical protein